MSKLDGTVRVKSTGERFVFHVESWSNPKQAHRVDLLARDGFGLCTCAASQITAQKAIRDGATWYDKKSACRHTIACRRFFERQLYADLAKTEGGNNS